jgi:dTDP-4-amino-4,6-dideoxygalactose transaminase
MKIPLLDLREQYRQLQKEIEPAVTGVLAGGQYIFGSNVREFEQEIAAYLGVKHALAVANGTDALFIILRSMGIGPGDEVITTPFTFFASAETVSLCGGKPVFVDIRRDTMNIDEEQVEAAITERTKAILPVHIFGQPCAMDRLRQIADKHNLFLVEDACQAIGSVFGGQKIGSLGDAAAFSFFPTKNLGCYGDGGLITTDDDDWAAEMGLMRLHGSSQKYYHCLVGQNSRLDEVQAAVLRNKLTHLDRWNQRRRELAARYNEAFADLPLALPHQEGGVYHLYILRSPEREDISAFLASRGIATGRYYPLPLHLQEVYQDRGYSRGSLPVAEEASDNAFAIPLYPELSERDQNFIIESIRQYFAKRVK